MSHHAPQLCSFVFKLLCFALTIHVNKHSEKLVDHSYTNNEIGACECAIAEVTKQQSAKELKEKIENR